MNDRPTLRHEIHYGNRIVRCYAHRPRSLHELFSAALERGASREALSSQDDRLSYGELDLRAGRLAALWRAQGLGRGDRIVLMISNRVGFVIAFLASQRLGAITVPVSIRESIEGLAFILEQCGARAIVHDRHLVERLPTTGARDLRALSPQTPAS